MSGQISGQVPNQSGPLPGISQQNGNPLTAQMQNPVAHANVPNMEPEFIRVRRNMQQRM